MSLQLDPFLWTSFQALCELGVEQDDYTAASAFGVALPVIAAGATAGTADQADNTWSFSKTPLQAIEPKSALSGFGGSSLRNRFGTPGLTPIPINQSMMMQHPETPVAGWQTAC